MNYFVYLLESVKDHSLYVGLTTNIIERIKEHNHGLSNYTKGHLPYKIMFYCVFPDKFIAARFEKYLKSASGKAFINKRFLK